MKGAYLLILAVILVLGCMEQAPSAPVCDRPYILVGTGCCLDDNGDGVCDKDKPVCAKPYILVGNECCLDIDANGACDRDQTTTTAAAATTSTAGPAAPTTTTPGSPAVEISGGRCATVDDCVPYYRLKCTEEYDRVVNITYGPVSCSGGVCKFRETADIGATHCYDWEVCVSGVCVPKEQTTTTTASYTTTTLTYPNIQEIIDRIATRDAEVSAYMATTTSLPPFGCFDSDLGIKYNVRSDNVSGYFAYNDTYMEDAREFCENSQILVEYYCVSNKVETFIHDCPGMCIDGHCCSGAGNLCDSGSDCCSGLCRMVGLTNHCI